MTNVDRILAEAMKLTDDERCELADRLVKAVHPLVDVTGDVDDLDAEERAALHRELNESLEEADRGELIDARKALSEIVSRP